MRSRAVRQVARVLVRPGPIDPAEGPVEADSILWAPWEARPEQASGALMARIERQA